MLPGPFRVLVPGDFVHREIFGGVGGGVPIYGFTFAKKDRKNARARAQLGCSMLWHIHPELVHWL